ncbi:STE/STE11/cdc15 protein kinase [Roridomyces roridus]|uniref:STE/STE11/cdc15 protein kinase n=1 Tax=Roridomyces roridus TaxID=1738132 RepID=A0AAD7BK05_9AGAR|nr:STE/STE11/cdc15 protein kinase [Roridomyces roridus]
MPSNRQSQKPSATPGASSSRLPAGTLSVSAAAGAPEPAPKTFHRIRSSLEQSLRTATRSKRTAQPVVGDFVTISAGASKGKERANNDEPAKEPKSKASVWNFRKSGRNAVTPSASPSPAVDTSEDEDDFEEPIPAFKRPTLRLGSMSSPALHLASQALPSPRSQPAIPASSSSTSDALVSPARTRRPSLQPLQRNLSDLPPTPPNRMTRHRATKSNPLNTLSPPPITPTRVASSPITPRRPTREPPSPPDTPTPMSGSRGHVPRSSSASSTYLPLERRTTPISPRGTSPSPIRPRSPSGQTRRVVTPLRGLSASTTHLPLSTSPGPSSPIDSPRRPSFDARRPSLDSPIRPSFRDESPSPVRSRIGSPSQHRPAYASRQHSASTTSLSLPPPSNPEHRDLIRTATSMLCKEVVKPPQHMSRTDAGQRDWEEVEVRVRALARLERIWGKSGGGGSSSNITVGTPSGINVGAEERERRLFTEALRDGFVLCQLMNKLRSSSIVRPDVRDDGFVRTSNITKFLAACSSYGLPEEDLFQRDDLIEASSESLARVARTIIALIKYVDAPIPSRSKVVAGQQKPSGIYGQGPPRAAAASTPNLVRSVSTPSPTPLARKRWSPPTDLPTVRSNSPGERSGTSSSERTPQHDREHKADREQVETQDKETKQVLSPPPRSPLRPQPPKVEDGLLSRAMNQVSPVRSTLDPVNSDLNHRQSVLSTSSAMTETTTTTMMSSLLDFTRASTRFGTIRTVATDMTSEAPSITRTEGSAIAEDLARKRAEPKLYGRDTKMSESFIDLSRVEEMDEAGTASRGLGRQWEQQRPPEVQRLDTKAAIRLGKGKWPDDFMDALQPQSPTTSELRSPSPSGISSPRKLAIVGATKRNESVESLPHVDAPVLRDSILARRHSTKPGPVQRTNSLAPRSSSREDSRDSLSDIEGSSRRRPRPSSYDELGVRPTRSRFESMMNLGGSSNASASDLLSRDSLDGNLVRQALIIREEGKPATHFQLGNCIGRGQFGSVYRALNLNTGQMVAVKRIRLEGLKEEEVTTLMREVDLVKSLSHPSIVKYEGMARDQDTLSIVLEYAENGSLGQTLRAFGKLNERLVASYVVKILEGLHYLHSSDVVHCDLKAANILTTKNGNVKLSDFGVSLNLRAMEREIKDVAGTPNWMAPEVIELKGASTKSDIWSLACTVIELLTGRPPYAEIANSMSVMFRIVEDDMPPLPEDCSPLLEDFLRQCFNKDPTKRPSAELLCEHQWLKKNWGAHKELRPQDSIPFLRRVSADLHKSDAARILGHLDTSEPHTPEIEAQVSSSPPKRHISLSTRPMDQDIPSRDHSFVKTTFSKRMPQFAVLCEQCSLIAHSRCAVNAPPTCDLRAQLLLYAQYAEKGNPGSAYSNPLDVLNEPHPMNPASEVAYVSHSPRTSIDGATPSPALHGSAQIPPTAFKFMAAFKRSRSNLSPEPDQVSSLSVPQVPPKDGVQKKLRKDPKERPQSVKSASTIATASMRSAESAASRADPRSLDETRTAMQRKRIAYTSAQHIQPDEISSLFGLESGGSPGPFPARPLNYSLSLLIRKCN